MARVDVSESGSMTKFSKILAVVATVACIGWLGFTMAVYIGGPNWQLMTVEREELREYEFARTEGENPSWTAKLRGSDQTVATDPNLAKVILQVEKDIEMRQNARLNGNPAAGVLGLQQQIDQLQTLLQQTQQFAAADVTALATRGDELEQDVAELTQQLQLATQEVIKRAEQVQKLQAEAAQRRGDVYRLRQLLAELQTDRERLADLQQKLRDRIVRGQADVDALKRRQAQLAG